MEDKKMLSDVIKELQKIVDENGDQEVGVQEISLEEKAKTIRKLRHRAIIVSTVQVFTSFVGIVCLLSSLMGIEHTISCVQIAAALLASLWLSLALSGMSIK